MPGEKSGRGGGVTWSLILMRKDAGCTHNMRYAHPGQMGKSFPKLGPDAITLCVSPSQSNKLQSNFFSLFEVVAELDRVGKGKLLAPQNCMYFFVYFFV